MPKLRKWFVVHERIGLEDRPIAAFEREELLNDLFKGRAGYTVMQRELFIGGSHNPGREATLERLLRDIVTPGKTLSDDRRMMRAIPEAQKLLNIPIPP